MKPLLTILIPCLPSRVDKLMVLHNKLTEQMLSDDHVEIIMLMDNKSMTIGEKRNALLTLVNGEYFCMIDDDDDVTDNFIDEILSAISIHNGVDVITFDSRCDIEGKVATINMSIHNPDNEQFKPDTIVKRKAWHMCVWRSFVAKNARFGLNMYGEDAPFMESANEIVETEHHIDEILHIYKWRKDVTEAFERD